MSVAHLSPARRLFGALAALALALHLLVPAGFMPSGDARAPLMLCDGQRPMPAMAMPARGNGPAKAPLHSTDHPCAFAGLAAPAIAPALAADTSSPAIATATPAGTARPAFLPGRGLAAPPPPSHAPPTLLA